MSMWVGSEWMAPARIRDARSNVRERGARIPMDPRDREKLYDWLANGKVDIWLRRIACERITELELALRDAEKILEPGKVEPPYGDEIADRIATVLDTVPFS